MTSSVRFHSPQQLSSPQLPQPHVSPLAPLLQTMAPTLYRLAPRYVLAIRSYPRAQLITARSIVSPSRAYSSNGGQKSDQQSPVGPNMEPQEHVSEEAAKTAKVMGGQGPDLDQGTPVQDILKEDKEARKDAPQVIKDSIKSGQKPPKPQSRPFSTSARQMRPDVESTELPDYNDALPLTRPESLETLPVTSNSSVAVVEENAGHKFGLPAIPLPNNMHKDYRYEPIVDQVTNLMMQHGEKAKAQRNMSYILHHLRTASPPVYNPARPLLTGARK